MDDDDLEAQIRAERAPEPEPAPDAESVRGERRVAPRAAQKPGIPPWVKVGAVFLVLGGGVAFLLSGTGAVDAFVYSKLVDEVMSDPAAHLGRELRVEGQLRTGSVSFVSTPTCEHQFVLERQGHRMPVRFPRCVVPDTFRDDMAMDVVVQGQLQSDGTFLANQVIPRCPSKYEMRQRQENGETMPHAPPTPGTTS